MKRIIDLIPPGQDITTFSHRGRSWTIHHLGEGRVTVTGFGGAVFAGRFMFTGCTSVDTGDRRPNARCRYKIGILTEAKRILRMMLS